MDHGLNGEIWTKHLLNKRFEKIINVFAKNMIGILS